MKKLLFILLLYSCNNAKPVEQKVVKPKTQLIEEYFKYVQYYVDIGYPMDSAEMLATKDTATGDHLMVITPKTQDDIIHDAELVSKFIEMGYSIDVAKDKARQLQAQSIKELMEDDERLNAEATIIADSIRKSQGN